MATFFWVWPVAMSNPTTLEKSTLLKFVQVFFLSGPLIGLSPDAQARRVKHSYTDDTEQSLSTALVKTPVDLEICFSPDEPCEAKLVKFVDSAKRFGPKEKSFASVSIETWRLQRLHP